MSDQSSDRRFWQEIKTFIGVNVSVILTVLVWLILFVGILIGYFSVILLVVVIILTVLTIRERSGDSNDDGYSQ